MTLVFSVFTCSLFKTHPDGLLSFVVQSVSQTVGLDHWQVTEGVP